MANPYTYQDIDVSEDDPTRADDFNRLSENAKWLKWELENFSIDGFTIDNPFELKISDDFFMSLAFWQDSDNNPYILGRLSSAGGAFTRTQAQFRLAVESLQGVSDS